MNTSIIRRSSKSIRLGTTEDFDNHASAGLTTYGTFFRMRIYANILARPALRRANVAEKARLHDCSRYHAWPGDRREQRDVQRRQRNDAAAPAVQRPGAASASGREIFESRDGDNGVFVS